MNRQSSIPVTAAMLACTLTLPTLLQAASPEGPSKEVYSAELQPMNTALTDGAMLGKATFVIDGDQLVIRVDVKDAPPGIVHWQHLHGFTNGKAAECPTMAADRNGDGIVDLIETEPVSGTTLVPLDKLPPALDIAHGFYPKASADGDYEYLQVVSVKELAAAFAKAFDGQALELDKRVVMIHGVPVDTQIPPTVQSLGTLPAHVTLPIACGRIDRVDR